MQIHGQTENTQYINIYFSNEKLHQYIYNNKNHNVFYLVIDKNGTVEKKIELCSGIKSCIFNYSDTDKILKLTVVINDITYNDQFKI